MIRMFYLWRAYRLRSRADWAMACGNLFLAHGLDSIAEGYEAYAKRRLK